jgi:hypothetical protein
VDKRQPSLPESTRRVHTERALKPRGRRAFLMIEAARKRLAAKSLRDKAKTEDRLQTRLAATQAALVRSKAGQNCTCDRVRRPCGLVDKASQRDRECPGAATMKEVVVQFAQRTLAASSSKRLSTITK